MGRSSPAFDLFTCRGQITPARLEHVVGALPAAGWVHDAEAADGSRLRRLSGRSRDPRGPPHPAQVELLSADLAAETLHARRRVPFQDRVDAWVGKPQQLEAR